MEAGQKVTWTMSWRAVGRRRAMAGQAGTAKLGAKQPCAQAALHHQLARATTRGGRRGLHGVRQMTAAAAQVWCAVACSWPSHLGQGIPPAWEHVARQRTGSLPAVASRIMDWCAFACAQDALLQGRVEPGATMRGAGFGIERNGRGHDVPRGGEAQTGAQNCLECPEGGRQEMCEERRVLLRTCRLAQKGAACFGAQRASHLEMRGQACTQGQASVLALRAWAVSELSRM